MMKYDRDIRRMRLTALGLTAINVIVAGHGLYARDWWSAIAGVVFALNCTLWLGILNVQQITRNQGRVLDAAVRHVLDLER